MAIRTEIAALIQSPLAFETLVHHMDDVRADILGDILQGAITYGEPGQYLTPGRSESGDMRSLCFNIDGVKGLAGGHEQTIPLRAAEANV